MLKMEGNGVPDNIMKLPYLPLRMVTSRLVYVKNKFLIPWSQVSVTASQVQFLNDA